jgi:hypothetical protein
MLSGRRSAVVPPRCGRPGGLGGRPPGRIASYACSRGALRGWRYGMFVAGAEPPRAPRCGCRRWVGAGLVTQPARAGRFGSGVTPCLATARPAVRLPAVGGGRFGDAARSRGALRGWRYGMFAAGAEPPRAPRCGCRRGVGAGLVTQPARAGRFGSGVTACLATARPAVRLWSLGGAGLVTQPACAGRFGSGVTACLAWGRGPRGLARAVADEAGCGGDLGGVVAVHCCLGGG